jgi:hypothetical protein
MARTMGDAIHDNVPALPNNLQLVAGYVTGSPDIVWTAADWARFPGIPHVTIDQAFTGAPRYDAVVIDIETGAYAPADVTNWMNHATAARPTIYVNRSNLTASAANALQSPQFKGDVWLAMPGWQPGQALPVLPAGCRYVAVQNQQDVANAYDLSVVLDPSWPAVLANPPSEEDVLATGSYPDGRMIVAYTGTDDNVYVTEQATPGSSWAATGPIDSSGGVAVAGGLTVSLLITGGVPSLFIQSADPPSSGNGDVYTSWKQPDGTWTNWVKIS